MSQTEPPGERGEFVTLDEVARWLGFSREHVVNLLAWGELHDDQTGGVDDGRISVDSVLAFQERVEQGARLVDDWSRSLDDAGAPSG